MQVGARVSACDEKLRRRRARVCGRVCVSQRARACVRAFTAAARPRGLARSHVGPRRRRCRARFRALHTHLAHTRARTHTHSSHEHTIHFDLTRTGVLRACVRRPRLGLVRTGMSAEQQAQYAREMEAMQQQYAHLPESVRAQMGMNAESSAAAGPSGAAGAGPSSAGQY